MATAAVMTKEWLDEKKAPDCPHCGADMGDARVTLGAIIDAWPWPRKVTVADDGYAYIDDRSLIVDCPTCFKPSAMAVSTVNFTLVACRTVKDRHYHAAMVAA